MLQVAIRATAGSMRLSANLATRGRWSAVAGRANVDMETAAARVACAAKVKKSAKAKSSTKVTMAKRWLRTIAVARVAEVDATKSVVTVAVCLDTVYLDTGACTHDALVRPWQLARRPLKSRIPTTRHVLRVIS